MYARHSIRSKYFGLGFFLKVNISSDEHLDCKDVLACFNLSKFKVWTGTSPCLTEKSNLVHIVTRLRRDGKRTILDKMLTDFDKYSNLFEGALKVDAYATKKLLIPTTKTLLARNPDQKHIMMLSLSALANFRNDLMKKAILYHEAVNSIQFTILYEWIDSVMSDLKNQSKKSQRLRQKLKRVRSEQARLFELYGDIDGIKTSLQNFIDKTADQMEQAEKRRESRLSPT